MTDVPQMLSVKQVAAIFVVSEKYVRDVLIKQGMVTAMRIQARGNWKIDAESVERMRRRKLGIAETSNEAAEARREAEQVAATEGWPLPPLGGHPEPLRRNGRS